MKRLLAAILVLATVHSTAIRITADEGPSKAVPELKPLDNYVGSWDAVITSNGAQILKGQATAEWILDGRFLQQTASFTTPDGSTSLTVIRLMTYDEKNRTYRIWGFLSNGMTREEEGTWDAKTRTMTLAHRSDGNTITTTAHFVEDGIIKLETVTTDRTGKEIAKTSGTSTRRKE